MHLAPGRLRRALTACGVLLGGVALFAAGALSRGDGNEKRVAVPGPERTVVVERQVGAAADSALINAGAPAVTGPASRQAAPPVTRKDGSVVTPVKEREAAPVRDDGPAPEGTFSAEQATADELVAAWSAGDRTAAREAATEDVVDALFRQTWTPGNRLLGCRRDVSGMVVCSYAEGTGTLGLYVAAAEDGYEVVGIEHTDPE